MPPINLILFPRTGFCPSPVKVGAVMSGKWQHQGAGKHPGIVARRAQKIGDSHSRARRAREWPKNASPKARGRAKLSLRFGASQCYYIYFSRFSQKSQFSWHNLSTLMTAKMHQNFSKVTYLQHKHHVKKSKQFVDRV